MLACPIFDGILFTMFFHHDEANEDWLQLMFAMEYNPNTFLLYETSAAAETTANISEKLLRQYGKFERNNVRTGFKDYQSGLAVFLAASILENKHKQILKEAKGLDDVAEVSLCLIFLSRFFFCSTFSATVVVFRILLYVQIMGDVTGNIDAKKACKEALIIQKKFLKRVSFISCLILIR